LEYAVRLVQKTRPDKNIKDSLATQYLAWGAGPRASQNLILSAKCYALLHGKFSPDIEDVKAMAQSVLLHRVVGSYKAEAEGISISDLISKML
jgi:MoxR-like ATPase